MQRPCVQLKYPLNYYLKAWTSSAMERWPSMQETLGQSPVQRKNKLLSEEKQVKSRSREQVWVTRWTDTQHIWLTPISGSESDQTGTPESYQVKCSSGLEEHLHPHHQGPRLCCELSHLVLIELEHPPTSKHKIHRRSRVVLLGPAGWTLGENLLSLVLLAWAFLPPWEPGFFLHDSETRSKLLKAQKWQLTVRKESKKTQNRKPQLSRENWPRAFQKSPGQAGWQHFTQGSQEQPESSRKCQPVFQCSPVDHDVGVFISWLRLGSLVNHGKVKPHPQTSLVRACVSL